MKFDPFNNERHYWIAMAGASFTGIIIGYVVFTIVVWDVDNDFPSLYPHRTLAQWIWFNQIQHIWRMLHEIW